MRISQEISTVLGLCIILSSMVASAADFTLGIYGNANLDDTIDDKDMAYVKEVIKGTKAPTNLADANHDGKINDLDEIQIEQIINGTEKEITVIDSANRTVTVMLPVKRIAVGGMEDAVAIRILGAMDRVVAVSEYLLTLDYDRAFFPELQELPSIGSEIDCEAVLAVKPDLLLKYSAKKVEEKNLPGVVILNLDMYRARNTINEMKILGYVLGAEERVQEYIDFCEPIFKEIKEKTAVLPSDKKARVYVEAQGDYVTHTKMGASGYQIELAGGQNIAADMIGGATGWLEVDPEWILTENPDIIVKMAGWNRDNTTAGYETDDFTSMKALRDYILNRPELAKVKAVENGNVEILAYDITYNPDYVISVAYLAKLFYPELFRDLDPVAIHQEYLDKFHKSLGWDVGKHGTFVYPPIAN
ncbi:MAG: Cobalamin-binding protein precursor [Methanosaeta sp. PtaU1.Bin060]|nr:MAG: Cobalamin-binding protein precursor [Methanosaeta sp. PtaU1.Bin060]